MFRDLMRDCVVYDIETARGADDVEGGWDNPQAMGFATAVAYNYREDRYYFYEGKTGHIALLKFLQSSIAVTFNGINFDSRVLLGNNRHLNSCGMVSNPIERKNRATDISFVENFSWFNFDLLAEYVRARFQILLVKDAVEKISEREIHDGSFNLDAMAQGTLNMKKTGDGAMAPVLYSQDEFAELFEYNLQDVRLTKKLFDFIMAHGYVVDGTRRKVKILDPLQS